MTDFFSKKNKLGGGLLFEMLEYGVFVANYLILIPPRFILKYYLEVLYDGWALITLTSDFHIVWTGDVIHKFVTSFCCVILSIWEFLKQMPLVC